MTSYTNAIRRQDDSRCCLLLRHYLWRKSNGVLLGPVQYNTRKGHQKTDDLSFYKDLLRLSASACPLPPDRFRLPSSACPLPLSPLIRVRLREAELRS